MRFIPQSIDWPADQAVLVVHGIGDASTGGDGAFPLDALRASLGDEASDFAFYEFNYDFINDWGAEKTALAAGLTRLKIALRLQVGDDELAPVVAEYAGDVLWPVLSADLRLAVRDAFLAQLAQIQIDRGEAALARGDDPLDYRITIVAHSLGCFHTYECLWAAALEPSHELRPRGDHFTLASVVLMASPVQLIRTVASGIAGLVPQVESLATLSMPLGIPSEARGASRFPCTRDFVALTGTHDPVGGHLLGARQEWAYMALPGQRTVIHTQGMLGIDRADALRSALQGSGAIRNPHSWSAYIEENAGMLRSMLIPSSAPSL